MSTTDEFTPIQSGARGPAVHPGVGWVPKCISCIGDYQLAVRDHANKILHDGVLFEPDWDRDVKDAVTLAPQWVPFQLPGQQMFGVCPVPTCLDHLNTEKKSIQQRATESGLILGEG